MMIRFINLEMCCDDTLISFRDSFNTMTASLRKPHEKQWGDEKTSRLRQEPSNIATESAVVSLKQILQLTGLEPAAVGCERNRK